VTLHLRDLVNCRWAEEVTIQLDSLKITEKHEEKDKLVLHLLFPLEQLNP
jgi:hypothetical protein